MNVVSTFTVQISTTGIDTTYTEALRAAIHNSIGAAIHEGDVPAATANAVNSWSVALSSSATADSDSDAQAAIELLRSKGYAVAVFSATDLGNMTVSEMEPYLKQMGKEAIEELDDDSNN